MAGKKHQPLDHVLFVITSILIILGILILMGVTASLSQKRFGTAYYLVGHQILFGLIPGLILGTIVFRTPIISLKKIAPFLLLGNLVLLGMVFLPKIGTGFGGATRWVSLGPISFQPSEFLKPVFFLYLATWLSSRTGKKRTTKTSKKGLNENLITFLIIVGLISLFLILQPDFSTLVIIIFVAVLMYFGAETPLWHGLLVISIVIGALLVLVNIAPYRMERFLVFLNPETDPMGIGYQIKQCLMTVGSGGISGLGLGLSRQKFGFLPGSMSDSIFAVFSEETGFIGSVFLISIFLGFLWRGFKIARESQEKFSKLCALGITSWIVIQAFVNIGSMIGILPLTGIPLPFISYGGSALIAELIGTGILLNISKK